MSLRLPFGPRQPWIAIGPDDLRKFRSDPLHCLDVIQSAAEQAIGGRSELQVIFYNLQGREVIPEDLIFAIRDRLTQGSVVTRRLAARGNYYWMPAGDRQTLEMLLEGKKVSGALLWRFGLGVLAVGGLIFTGLYLFPYDPSDQPTNLLLSTIIL